MALNGKAIKIIHIAKNQLHLNDDIYRDILATRYNKTTSKNLTYEEYKDLMGLFEQMGFRAHIKPATAKGGTKKQVKEVWRLVKEHNVDLYRLVGIIKYVTKIDASEEDPLKWLGRKELSALIQALRRWKWDLPFTKKL